MMVTTMMMMMMLLGLYMHVSLTEDIWNKICGCVFAQGRRRGVHARDNIPRRLQYEKVSSGKSTTDRHARRRRALPGRTT